MKILKITGMALMLASLTACATKVPLKGSISQDAWVGYYTANPHTFSMTNGVVKCEGKPKSSWSDFTVLIDFTCTDGRTGTLKEDKAMSGKASVTFSDGSSGNFLMGHGI
jgi:hypothetical protein